jgi:hypothetical protein
MIEAHPQRLDSGRRQWHSEMIFNADRSFPGEGKRKLAGGLDQIAASRLRIFPEEFASERERIGLSANPGEP